MDLNRLITGSEPFVTNVPVFSSATGLLLRGAVLGRTPSSGASSGVYVLTVPSTTAAMKDVIGVLNESIAVLVKSRENSAMNASGFHIDTSDNIPNAGVAAGSDWAPCVINPDQMLFALWDQTSANVIQASITASTGVTVTITSLEDDIDGAWIFSTDTTAALTNTYSGSLRYATASAASVLTLNTAMNVSTDSDLVVVRPITHRLLQADTNSVYMRSTVAAGLCVAMHNHDNLIVHDQAPLHPLRFWVDDGLNGLKGVRLYSTIVFLKHAYRAVV